MAVKGTFFCRGARLSSEKHGEVKPGYQHGEHKRELAGKELREELEEKEVAMSNRRHERSSQGLKSAYFSGRDRGPAGNSFFFLSCSVREERRSEGQTPPPTPPLRSRSSVTTQAFALPTPRPAQHGSRTL